MSMAVDPTPTFSLWRGRSLRWQVLAAMVAINLCAALAAAAVVIANARRATTIEINSSIAVAERLVEETVERLVDASGGAASLAQLPLHIRGLRHVRIRIQDAQGRAVDIAPHDDGGGDAEDGTDEVPDWFADLVTVDRLEREIPVVENGETIGRVLVMGEASDEIAEVWEDMSDLAMLALAVNLAILIALYLVLGRLLRPLKTLSAGLYELEEGRFEHRIPTPKVRDLALIADRFNALGAALKAARDDNARLHGRLISVQDDERRQIAADLHDELGPCLFGMRANLESVERLAARAEPEIARRISERTGTIAEILDRVQGLNRRLLRKIRPMALGHVPLAAVIADLVADFESHSPGHDFHLSAEGLAERYGDIVDITVYRCIQEAVTNALRHGDAKAITIKLRDDTDAGCMRLVVEDDGIGMAPEAAPGFGLIGIEERLNALGGKWRIGPVIPTGTRVEMDIPTRIDDATTSELSPKRSAAK
jgi:two-component system sensor histidine kinase UhpB